MSKKISEGIVFVCINTIHQLIINKNRGVDALFKIL